MADAQTLTLTRTYPTSQNPLVTAAEIGARIRTLRIDRGISQEDLAERAKLGRDTIVRLEKGENTRLETLLAVAAALRVPVRAVLVSDDDSSGDDVHDERVDVSVGYVKDDLPVIFEGDASPRGLTYWDEGGRLLPEITDRISRPSGLTDSQAYGVRVRGDSMRPKYEPGDVLVVSPNLAVSTGLRCYLQLKSGERLIKQVRRTMAGWLLESINQAYESREVRDDEIEFMHRIIWAREKSGAPSGNLRVVDENTGRRVEPDEGGDHEPPQKPVRRQQPAEKEDRDRFRGDDRDRTDEV